MCARRRRVRPSGAPAILAIAGALALLVLADRCGLLLVPPRVHASDYDGVETLVIRVVDGDTIDVAIGDASTREPFTRVRIWGIDCPELPRTGRGGEYQPGEPLAYEAKEACRRLAIDERVTLTIEPSRVRDRYGRLLAHVDLAGGHGLAKELLHEGLATADDRWPHARLREHAKAERRAQRNKLGIWARK